MAGCMAAEYTIMNSVAMQLGTVAAAAVAARIAEDVFKPAFMAWKGKRYMMETQRFCLIDD